MRILARKLVTLAGLGLAVPTTALAQSEPDLSPSETQAITECGADPSVDPVIYVESGPYRAFREFVADASRDGNRERTVCLAESLLEMLAAREDSGQDYYLILSLIYEYVRDVGDLELAGEYLFDYFLGVESSGNYNELATAYAEILTEMGEFETARDWLDPVLAETEWPGVQKSRLYLASAKLAAAEGNDRLAAREYGRTFDAATDTTPTYGGYQFVEWLDLADAIAKHGDTEKALSAYRWIAENSSMMGFGSENRKDRPNFVGRLAMDRIAKIHAGRGDKKRARFFAIPALIDVAYDPEKPDERAAARKLAYEMEQIGSDLFKQDDLEYQWSWQLRLAFLQPDFDFKPDRSWLRCGPYPMGNPQPEPEPVQPASGSSAATLPPSIPSFASPAPSPSPPPIYQTKLDEQIDANRIVFGGDIIPFGDRDARLLVPTIDVLSYANACLNEGNGKTALAILNDHIGAMQQAGYGGDAFREMADLRATLASQVDDFEGAERQYLAVIDDLLSRPEGFDFKDLHGPFFSLISVYERYGRWDRAEALSVRMMNIPIYGTNNSQRMGLRGLQMGFAPNFHMVLIKIYLEQGKVEQARNLIVQSYPMETPSVIDLDPQAYEALDEVETSSAFEKWLLGQSYLAQVALVDGDVKAAIKIAESALAHSDKEGEHTTTRPMYQFRLMPWEEEALVREALGRAYLADKQYENATDTLRQTASRRIVRQLERENAEEAEGVYQALGEYAQALVGVGEYHGAAAVVQFADAIFAVREAPTQLGRERGRAKLADAGANFAQSFVETVPKPEQYEIGDYTHSLHELFSANPQVPERFGALYAAFLVEEEGRNANLSRLSRETTTALTAVRMRLAEVGAIDVAAGLAAGKELVTRLDAQWAASQSASFDSAWQLRNLVDAPEHYLRQSTLAWKAQGQGAQPVDREEIFSLLQRGSYNVVDLTLTTTIARGLFGERQPDLIPLLDRRDELLQTFQAATAMLSTNQFRGLEQEVSLGTLLQDISALDGQIQSKYPEYLEFMRADPVAIKDAQALLKPGEALVMLAPASGGTHAFTIKPDKVSWKLLDISEDEINAQVRRLLWFVGGEIKPTIREELAWTSATDGGQSGFDRDTAFALYLKIVAPLMEDLEGSDQLFLAPSGALATLPFGMLVTERPTGLDNNPEDLRATAWLADKFPMVQVPSFNSFAALRRFASDKPAGNQPFMGFGAPVLSEPVSNKATSESNRGERELTGRLFQTGAGSLADISVLRSMDSLRNAKTELEQMARAFGAKGNKALLLEDEFTEDRIRSMDLSDTQILAFATHALVADDGSGLTEPGLVLTPPNTATSANDGYLSASEIAALDLNAMWVVLSACNTAAGDPSSGAPGLSGLVRSFFFAGARNLLASHWKVGDEVAAQLTVRTVELGQENDTLSRAAAFQLAMREIRENAEHDGVDRYGFEGSWSHPRKWAPFSLIGAGE